MREREKKKRGEKDTRENWLLYHCGSEKISLLTPFILTQHASDCIEALPISFPCYISSFVFIQPIMAFHFSHIMVHPES